MPEPTKMNRVARTRMGLGCQADFRARMSAPGSIRAVELDRLDVGVSNLVSYGPGQ